MDSYQLAWLLYGLGGFGCGLAAGLLFRRFGREWGHFFMVSLWVLLLTPYALDTDTMVMAPAIFILIMDGLVQGFDAVKAIAMLLLGLWLIGLILSLLFQLATRRSRSLPPPPKPRPRRPLPSDELSHDEQTARSELLDGEIPLRAER